MSTKAELEEQLMVAKRALVKIASYDKIEYSCNTWEYGDCAKFAMEAIRKMVQIRLRKSLKALADL